MSKIDLEQLGKEIRSMQRWSRIYKILKRELSLRGYWKNRQRGNPSKAYKVMLKRKQKGLLTKD